MKRIGIITDDMTGTMTCGVLLARAGIKACSYFSPDNLEGADNQDAVILSANSRNVDKATAKQQVKACYHKLVEEGAGYFTKRIDTTFRGGIGYEVDAMLEEMPEDTIAIMAATMPDTHRIVVGGYSIIDGVILTETGVKNDVLFPVTQPHIPTLMAEQSDHKVDSIGINDVLDGEETLKASLVKARENGARIIVIDAITTPHLATIAKTVYNLGWNVLCVDPGAFTQQLALCRGFGNPDLIPQGQQETAQVKGMSGKVFAIAGSATEVTKNQITNLGKEEYVRQLSVNTANLVDGGANAEKEIERAVAEGVGYINEKDCRVIIVETAVSNHKLSLSEEEEKYGLSSGMASANINAGLGKIVGQLIDKTDKEDLNGIYMTGGDTLVSILQSLNAAGIRLIDTVQPQTNLGMIIGGKYDSTRIVGKGGLIGDNDTALRVINRLYYESQK